MKPLTGTTAGALPDYRAAAEHTPSPSLWGCHSSSGTGTTLRIKPWLSHQACCLQAHQGKSKP